MRIYNDIRECVSDDCSPMSQMLFSSITAQFHFVRQLLLAGLHDPAIHHDVYVIRLHMLEDTIEVRDDEDGMRTVAHTGDTIRHDLESVHIEPRVRLVKDDVLRIKDGHLENLHSFA